MYMLLCAVLPHGGLPGRARHMTLRLLDCATRMHGNACCRAANGAGFSPVVWPSMMMHRCAGPCVLEQGAYIESKVASVVQHAL